MTSRQPDHLVFALPLGLSLGGVETWTLQMCRALGERGFKPVLASHATPGDRPTLTAPTDVPMLAYPSGRAWSPRGHAAALMPVLPATIIPNGSIDTLAACAVLSRREHTHLRVIGFAHTYDEYYFALLCHYEPLIHRFVAVSEECAAVLRKRLPHRQADVVTRPYGVHVPVLLERSYAAPGEPLRLIYAGRIEQRQKCVFDLLTLAALLAERGVDFHMNIVGEGADKAALQQRHALLPKAARQRVTIAPGVGPNEVPQLLERHDICLLVSEYEGTSIFMLEGLAHGCVPVVTDVSGTGQVIEHGDNGYRVPRGDLAGMAEVLRALDDDRDGLAARGRAAHESAKRYAFTTYLAWFESTIDAIWREPARIWPAARCVYPTGLRLRRIARGVARRVPGFLPLVRIMIGRR